MVQYLDNNSGFNQWNSANKTTSSKKKNLLNWVLMFLLAWWVAGSLFPKRKVTISESHLIPVEKSSASITQIDSDKLSADVQGLRIFNIALKDYNKTSKTAEHVTLLDDENTFIEIGFQSGNTQTPNVNTKWNTGADNNMVWNNKFKINFSRHISIDNYMMKITDTIKNNSGKEISISPYVRVVHGPAEKTSSAVETGGIAYANSHLNYINWANLNKKSFAYSTVRGYFGFSERYWETIVSMDAHDQTISLKQNSGLYFADGHAAPIQIKAGQSTTFDTYIFAGPKMVKVLNQASENIPNLGKTMDYGWFWFFSKPMLLTLNWLFDMVGNYGVAIILMTLMLRLLMWPLTRKSYASTMMMQKIQPELQRVQKLYANDKARLQMEMMKIYQTHKTSPMSGCLPMLLQIPIFFALYKAVSISVPMHMAKFLWISDLAVMDPYFILPVLMGVTMLLQQFLQGPKTSVNANDAAANSQRIMKWMPILFTIMFAWMPAGLILYWTVSNIFSICQMYIIKKTSK